ncbi:MAG TPA: hypothetical protein VLC54_12035, partial [Anaeromyxobacter sp.]|nr:hypothetical protein [Anaeromyxobacter sp.]
MIHFGSGRARRLLVRGTFDSLRRFGSLIVVLLRKSDRLLLRAHLHPQPVRARCDREIAVAEPAHQVERLLRRLLLREPQRVRLHAPLDRGAHLRRAAEEAVRRHQAAERLVRALEVVAVDEQRETPRTVGEVREHGSRQELLPERLPEPLDLPERLRVLRPALHVSDSLAAELAFELRRASPRGVLAALVGEDLPRGPVGGDPAVERLEHERRALVVRQRVADEEARVVVHERGQIEPLVTPQQEREDV